MPFAHPCCCASFEGSPRCSAACRARHRAKETNPKPLVAGGGVMSEPSLSPTLAEEVDRVCNDFEAAWRAVGSGGWAPRLEDYLRAATQEARPHLLRELLGLELDYRRRRGEWPEVE